MQLSDIVRACEVTETVVSAVEISSIAYDSRQVTPGSAFFALPGLHSDGHSYIQQALENGAAAVFYESDAISSNSDRPFIHVRNSRIALSRASAAFYGHPVNELVLIGVTGTDGKSSTVSFLHQLLEASGISAGLISTVSIQTGEESRPNELRQSTPEAPEIHRALREMVDSGKLVAVLESTSHGLSEKTARLHSVNYDGAIFTNIDHEHLEFHGSFEQYLSDKAGIFRRLRRVNSEKLAAAIGSAGADIRAGFQAPADPVAVINKNDEQFPYLSAVAQKQEALTRAFSLSADDSVGADPVGADPDDESAQSKDDVRADRVIQYADHSTFRLRVGGPGTDIRLPIPAVFNIENVLGAVGILYYLFGISPEALAKHIARLEPLRGRMLSLFQGQNFDVIVDYAHTPGSFRRLFPMLRLVCRKRLIAVFGSAGERDTEKRPIQGSIAAEYADIIILTDEDPRLEDSTAIINDIAGGISNCPVHKISDRRAAIEKAINIAEDGDMVVMLGKGHEKSIITAAGNIPWDEEAEVRTALERRGYRRPPSEFSHGE